MTLDELLKQSSSKKSNGYANAGELLSASKATSSTPTTTPTTQQRTPAVITPETPAPINKSSALSFLKTGFDKLTNKIADTNYFKQAGAGLNEMASQGKTSAAEIILKPASFGVGNLENIPLGVGEAIKQGKEFVNNQDPYIKNLTFKDWVTGVKETGQAFAGSVVSGATEVPSLLTAGTYAPEIKFNIPGIGEVSNSDYKIADRVSKGEDPNLVVLSEKTTGFMNALFFIGLATKPFIARPTVVTKGSVPVESGITVKQPMKSFRPYEAPSYTQPLTPAFMDQMKTQKGINFGNKYDPNLPSYFRMTSGSNGKIVGEIVQVKPSYFSILKDKFLGDVTKVPPEGVNVLTTKETGIKTLENLKPTNTVPVVPPVVSQPVNVPTIPKAEIEYKVEQLTKAIERNPNDEQAVTGARHLAEQSGDKALVDQVDKAIATGEANIKKQGETQAKLDTFIEQSKPKTPERKLPGEVSPKEVPPEPKRITITHFTADANVNSILENGFDASKAPIHGTGGLEGGAKTGKAGGDVLYFTTDNGRWNSATVFVGEGKGTISRDVYDYDKQAWVKENNAYEKVNLSPIEAKVNKDAKILTIGSLNQAMTVIQKNQVPFDKYNMIQQLIDAGKNNGFDIVNIKNPGGKAWEYPNGMTTRNGETNWYNTLTGNSGKDDYFVLNKDVLDLPKPKTEAAAKPSVKEASVKTKPSGKTITVVPEEKLGPRRKELLDKVAYTETPKQLVSKTDLKTAIKTLGKESLDLKVIKKDGKLYMKYKDGTQEFILRPSALGLIEENIKVGDTINISLDNLKATGTTLRGVDPKGGTLAMAKYQPKDLPNLSGEFGGINAIKPVEMPELVRMTRELMGNFPEIVKSSGKAAGRFYPKDEGRIKLIASLFNKESADMNQAARVLAHEMGHLVDYLPDHMIKRGNLLGRLQVLRKFMDSELDGVKNADVRKELLAVTKYWHPYDPKTVPESYKKYRESSVELYAEALSMLLTDPGKLEKMAPIFYKEFFKNLDKKPDVMEAYFKTQELLSGEPEALFEARMNDILAGFARGEEIQAGFRAKKELGEASYWEKLRQQVDDKNYPILKKQRIAEERGQIFPDSENPKFLLEEQTLVDNENFLMVDEIQKNVLEPMTKLGMTQEDLGQYLMLNRIATERAEIANPYGFDVKTAKEQLNYLKKTLGNDRYSTLEDSAKKFQEIIFPSVEEAVKVGSYNKELFDTKIKPNKGNYAAFQVLDYMQDRMPAGIKAQTGTLKEISNPFVSTILKTISLNRLNAYQRAKNATINLLKDNFADEITRSEPIMQGNVRVGFKKVEDTEHLQVLEDGKLVSYNVDPYIAKSFEVMKPGDLNVLVAAADVFNNRIFKPLVTTFNLGFSLGTNPIRDFKRNYKNIPNATVYSLLKAYVSSLPESIKYSKGELDTFTRQLVESKALGAPINDYNFDPIETEYGAILERMGIVKETPKIINPLLKAVAKPAIQIMEAMRFIANTFENVSKIAGAKVRIAGGETGGELAFNLRNYTGTPNYRNKGTHTRTTNAIFVFSNIMKEGLKSDFQIATNPKTRSGYWWKTVKVDLLPKFLQFLAAAGVGGALLKEFFDNVSEYDKTNYIIIPIGYKDGKSVYIRIPHDETGRLLAATFWKTMNFATERKLTDVQQIFSLGAGQFPSVTPAIDIAKNWSQYLSGKNPYDSFRGRNLIDDTTWEAGGGPALKKMVEWTTNSIGITKFATYDDATKTTLETFMQIAPWFSSMIKISDYGVTESLNEVAKEQKSKEAQQTLKTREAISNNLRPALNDKENLPTYLRNTIIESLGPVPEDPTKVADYVDEAKKVMTKFTKAVVSGNANNPIEKAISSATSNEQKAAILKYIQENKGEEKTKEIISNLLEDKSISKDVILKFLNNSKDEPVSKAEQPSKLLSLVNGILGTQEASAAEIPKSEQLSVKDLKFSENDVPYFWKDKKATNIDKVTVTPKPIAPITKLVVTDPRPGYSQTITDPAKLKVAEKIASISNAVAPEYTNYLLRIAQYEGRLDPLARNDKGNTKGGVDQGVFQINTKAFPQITKAQAEDLNFATLWALSLIQAGKQDKWVADQYVKGKVKLDIK